MARLLATLLGVGAAAAASAGVAVAVKRRGAKGGCKGDEQPAAVQMQAMPTQPEPVADAPAPPEPAPAAPEPSPLARALKGNEALFSGKELALVSMLLEHGQAHIFAAWPPPGEQDGDKRRLLAQVATIDASYHGGLSTYLSNAKQLLADSKLGANPFDGYTPLVPEGEALDYGSSRFMELEAGGLAAVGRAAFVLVAGGLGERLGYQGIKVSLPCESASGTCFLESYIRTILALQEASGATAEGRRLPLAIMTSDDTHARTAALLEAHGNFGMAPGQVTLLKQEKVPCLVDNDAHLALDPKDPFLLQTKPHGHGDVHALLHSSGLARAWQADGLAWVCFFQDTNALVFRALLAALGVSAANGYDMNSLAVPRKAKEAIGAITKLVGPGGATMTVNVEYNQLDPLLRATVSPDGDVNDASGWSPFPGNINQLVLKLSSYVEQLAATGGVISEFVNPKYADASKTAFKSSTRLECMMQDYPKALPADAKVGFTVVKQVWATYSPVKNSPADARAKAAEGNPTHSATTAEMDVYKANFKALALVAGAEAPGSPLHATYNGIPVEEWPRVVLAPSFAASLADIKAKVSPGSVLLAPRSVLLLQGRDISISNLRVDGALVVRAVPGAHVVLDGLSVSNAGWEWAPLDEAAGASPEDAMRGFRVVKHETMELVFEAPGEYRIPDVAAAAAAARQEGAVAEQEGAAAGAAEQEAAGAAEQAAAGAGEAAAEAAGSAMAAVQEEVAAAEAAAAAEEADGGPAAGDDEAAAAAAAVAAGAVQAVLAAAAGAAGGAH